MNSFVLAGITNYLFHYFHTRMVGKKRTRSMSVETRRKRMRVRLTSQRTDVQFRAQERAADTSRRREARSSSDVRSQEQAVNTNRRRQTRSSSDVRSREQAADTNRRRQARHEPAWENCVHVYESNIKEGPIHPCFCCDRLFFKKSIIKTTKSNLLLKGCVTTFLDQLVFQSYKHSEGLQFCSTCNASIRQKKVPRLCVNASNLAFPHIPDIVKKLSPLEERCVAPRIPFMKLYALGVDRQFGLRGGIVNVPVDVHQMVSSIPVHPNQTGTIQLKLKRRIGYVQHYMYETVSSSAIYDAACYLVTTPLYKAENICLDSTWLQNDIKEFIVDDDDDDEQHDDEQQTNSSLPVEIPTVEKEQVETEEQQISEETLIDSCDGIEFAPGEGQMPLSMLLDKNAEELAFPTIYGGVAREVVGKLSYDMIANSELRRSDRRAVRPDHLLFMYKKSQLIQMSNNINIALRKKANNASVTAGKLLNDTFLNDLTNRDDGYRFLSGITGTPPYWEKQKKNVLAMHRQLGISTLFITLSAAETKWTDLLRILKTTVDKDENADVSNLDFQEKARLIRSDPVTCALYFDHRFKELKKTWNNSVDGPFGPHKIKEIYYRVEFQHRGSPHVHMLLWLEKAPIYDPDNQDTVEAS